MLLIHPAAPRGEAHALGHQRVSAPPDHSPARRSRTSRRGAALRLPVSSDPRPAAGEQVGEVHEVLFGQELRGRHERGLVAATQTRIA